MKNILFLFLLLPLFCGADLLKQSTARNVVFFMTDSTDSVTGKTGLTVTCTLSKDAGAFGASGGSVSEISSGWYSLAANTTDTGTLGFLAGHCTATGADPTDFLHQVVADLPGATVSSVTGAVGSVTGAVGSVTGNVGGNVVGSVASVTAGVTVSTNSDKTGYTVSTVSDKTGYSLSSGGIQAVWDALTSNLTTTGSIGKLLVTDINAAVGSTVTTSHFDTILGTPSVSVSADIATRAPSSTALSTAQWTNARAADIDNLDATISSRLATSGYTAPDNSDISAIKIVTDKFLFDGSSFVKANVQTNSDKTGYSLAGSQIPIKKNTALNNFDFPIIGSSTGNPTTGLTVSCQRSIDGGAFGNCANSVVEISNGYYKINFAAGDLNGDTIVVRFYGTGIKEKSITFVTQ